MKKFNFQTLPKWLQSNLFYRAALKVSSGEPGGFAKKLTEVHPLDANLISSEKANGRHVLMLDVDQESFAVESSTTGHSHIYINTDLELAALKEIVDVLAKHGVLQEGIKQQLDANDCLTLRPPGVKKNEYEDSLDVEDYKVAKKHIAKAAQITAKYANGGAVLPPAVAKAMGSFKQTLTGKSSKDYEVEYAIKKEIYRVTVPQEVLGKWMQAISLKLGWDYAYMVAKSASGFSPISSTEGVLQYRGNVIANIHYGPLTDSFLVEFRQEFFKAPDIIPEGWPSWEYLVKVMSQF